MKYCEEYGALLDAFADGELSPEDSARVREHLKTCGGCRSYVDAALAIRGAFPDEEDTAVPEGFADGVMAAIRSGAAPRETAAKRRGWKKVLLPLAACFALAVLARGIPMGGSSGNTASTTASAAMETAPAAAAAPASIAAAEEVRDSETAGAAQITGGAAPAAGAPEQPMEDGVSAKAAEQNVFYTAASESASSESQTEDCKTPAAAEPAAGTTASAAPTDTDGGEIASVSVSLTPEQREALRDLLDGYAPVEEAGPRTVYRLTGPQLREFLTELERLGISAAVIEPEDGGVPEEFTLFVTLTD